MSDSSQTNTYGLIVIGSGAAGLSAAVYAGRYLMKTLVIGDEFGGQTSWGGSIENYPGIKQIDGFDLMKEMKEQAQNLGAEVKDGRVSEIEREGACFTLTTEKGEIFHSDTIILATGAARRRLNLPKEKELTGKGVHYCVTCDAPLYGGKNIAIVGGGDASVKGANLAAEYANKIYLITRDERVTAEPINYKEMQEKGNQIEIITETEVEELVGEDMFEKAILTKPYNGSKELDVDGLFIEIGAIPETDLAEQVGAELDETGHIQVTNMMRTSVPGVYAAGDSTFHFEEFKQDITAAAMGAVAATSAYEDYKGKDKLCYMHAKPRAAGFSEEA